MKNTLIEAFSESDPGRKRKENPNPLISRDTLLALTQGDHQAFNQIYALYYEKIRLFIHLLLHSADEAQEIAQHIFCNLWEKREKIDPSRNFNAYLYLVARHAVYDFVKHKAVRNNYVSRTWEIDLESPSSEELIVAREAELLTEMVVSRMPTQRKKIFQMSRYENLDNTEIAERLNISRNAVEKQLRLALVDIRNVLTLFIILFISAK